MKKVLALVLAVIMVCTMAMANENINLGSKDYTVVTITGGAVAAIELAPTADLTKSYVLQVPDEYFGVLNAVLGGKTNAQVFSVTGLSGNWASDGKYYINVPVADKALDGVADLTLGAFTIKKDANNYAEVAVKDGKLKVTKVVIGSMDVTEATGTAALVTAANNKALDASYDVGLTTTPLDTTTPAVNANGWYVNTQNKEVKIALEDGKVVITVPAKATFKFEKKAITTPVVTGANFTGIITNGYKVTGATLNYAIRATQGSNDVYYAADASGNLYAAGLTFTIVKDALGETGYWTLKTTDYVYGIFTADKVLTVNALPGTTTGTTGTTGTGTTTNPGTGANDVVGVAAALAVVALVSGAAISLKK